MRTQSIDTPVEVERLLIERYRAMGPRGRLAAALELNAELEQLARAGIRARYGELPPQEERLRLFALRLGHDPMRLAFGWDPGNAGA
jgi:hypothetical protein